MYNIIQKLASTIPLPLSYIYIVQTTARHNNLVCGVFGPFLARTFGGTDSALYVIYMYILYIRGSLITPDIIKKKKTRINDKKQIDTNFVIRDLGMILYTKITIGTLTYFTFIRLCIILHDYRIMYLYFMPMLSRTSIIMYLPRVLNGVYKYG